MMGNYHVRFGKGFLTNGLNWYFSFKLGLIFLCAISLCYPLSVNTPLFFFSIMPIFSRSFATKPFAKKEIKFEVPRSTSRKANVFANQLIL